MKCTKCGKDLAPIAKFCTNCGAEIVQDINNENTVNTNSFESTIEKNETIDIPKNENVSKISFIDNLKENWNDKYTIEVIIAVMVVAALLGTVVKKINTKNDFSNTDSYAENEQYINNDTDEQQYIDNNVNENNNENDNWDSAQDTNENIQDIVDQEEEIGTLEVQQYILPGSDTRYLTKEELSIIQAKLFNDVNELYNETFIRNDKENDIDIDITDDMY